ncbi:TPA: hypothetical protein DEO28_00120 [Candidatus Dependentiae bacterium]|nr:MAG: hypothetical protein UR14_C0001G0118 [candidate division TM6 bacterium GW2011_GWE2_31_21]KKP54002.1 MAG: hypothetical protein UR43_C0001G0020 [candidate division TM6 bacterium GW2011_GWF2_33_332]HBS48417.1 hypothetical protein [Candidatus Dependentiae bacterium]HBZ72909.1 hypothetical protein [Candidatus Dependentiae bacterium]
MKTNVRSFYNAFRDGVQDYNVIEFYMDEMKKAAEKDPIEFEYLINLFNEEEKDEENKLILAEVLISLKWPPIKEKLHEFIDKSDYLSGKIEAAECLIDIGDESAADYLIKLAEEAYKKNDDDSLVSAVYTLLKLNNKKGTQLFLSLVDKYPILIKYFEERRMQGVIERVRARANE